MNGVDTLTQLPSLWQTIGMALRLEPEIYALVQSSRAGLTLALAVMALAALSEAAGQSVVLFINRVRPGRYLLALAIAVASNVIGYLLWSSVVWLTVLLVFDVRVPFVAALAVVGLAYAPQIFAFFEVTPYFGNFFGLLLTLWSMAAIVVAVRVGMGLETWQAAVTGLVSWVVIQLWRRSLGRPIYGLGRAIERRAAGARLEYSMADIVSGRLHREQYSPNWTLWLQGAGRARGGEKRAEPRPLPGAQSAQSAQSAQDGAGEAAAHPLAERAEREPEAPPHA